MRILTSPPTGRGTTRAVIIYGRGLIARPVYQHLGLQGWQEILDQPAPWGDPAAMATLGKEAHNRLCPSEGPSPPERIDLLWAAGVAGFSALAPETAAELLDYSTVLDLAKQLAATTPTNMHLASSAGGLFAGQRRVTTASTPAPVQPYGQLKLAQEEALLATDKALGKHIYRLTSVYGYVDKGCRQGLIPTMIHNGIRHRVSTIFGSLETIRDYLWTEDVARYICDRMLAEGDRGERRIEILGSGRPRTIAEIIAIIQNIIGHHLYVSVRPDAGNRMDITFAPEALPKTWHPSDLEVNVNRVYLAARGE